MRTEEELEFWFIDLINNCKMVSEYGYVYFLYDCNYSLINKLNDLVSGELKQDVEFDNVNSESLFEYNRNSNTFFADYNKIYSIIQETLQLSNDDTNKQIYFWLRKNNLIEDIERYCLVDGFDFTVDYLHNTKNPYKNEPYIY